MKYKQMSEGDVFEYLDRPFNPPAITEESAEEEFFREWHATEKHVDAALSRLGKRDDFGREDYSMGDTANLSRGLSVVLTSTRMINSEVVRCVQHALRQLEEAYEVYLHVETDKETSHLFIDEAAIKGCCSHEIALVLGLELD